MEMLRAGRYSGTPLDLLAFAYSRERGFVPVGTFIRGVLRACCLPRRRSGATLT